MPAVSPGTRVGAAEYLIEVASPYRQELRLAIALSPAPFARDETAFWLGTSRLDALILGQSQARPTEKFTIAGEVVNRGLCFLAWRVSPVFKLIPNDVLQRTGEARG